MRDITEISKKWEMPKEEVSCPSCGYEYGHHRTQVDSISEECSTCAKKSGYKKINLMSATEFINKYVLGIGDKYI